MDKNRAVTKDEIAIAILASDETTANVIRKLDFVCDGLREDLRFKIEQNKLLRTEVKYLRQHAEMVRQQSTYGN